MKTARQSVVAVILGITAALTLLAFDLRADSPFLAPKRLVAMLGIALAFVAWCATSSTQRVAWTSSRRAIAICALAALALIVASALASPRRVAALDSVRTIVVFAAVPFLCAATNAWAAVSFGFIAGAAINAVISLLQWRGVYQPFQYVTTGGRAQTSALVGNSGILGIALAFAAILLLPRLVRAGRARIVAGALFALMLAAVVQLRSVTAVAVMLAGVAIFVVRHLGRLRFAIVVVLVAIILGAGAWVVAGRGRELAGNAQSWNQLTTYRLGPWAAAAEMIVARPLLGWGAGTYAAEFAPHLVDAQLRWQARLDNPALLGSYAEAHNDVLQSLAEIGAPATILVSAVIVLLGWPLVRAHHEDAPVVLAVIATGALAALAWFPMQRLTIAMLLLAATGHAWRILSEETRASERGDASPSTRRRRSEKIGRVSSQCHPERVVEWGAKDHLPMHDPRSVGRGSFAPTPPPAQDDTRARLRMTRWVFATFVITLILPELPRYHGERELYRLNGATQQGVTGNLAAAERAHLLRDVSVDAERLRTYPGDWRPLTTAGTASLLAGDGHRAAVLFGKALEHGERPELDVNLGFALLQSGADPQLVENAFTRAAWICPAFREQIQERGFDVAKPLFTLEAKLGDGTLRAEDLPQRFFQGGR